MLQPGSQIGRYEIQRRLGRGGMGTVYVAHDPVLGRLVAIKVFATDLDLADANERFSREARSAASLNHPNIVTIHDYGDVESQPFIVMEYVQGETLADIIRRKAPIALHEKLRWIEELCAGASYAHKSGVLHRDIKPTNLMVNRTGQLKILDFGIARMIGTLSPKATALVGTPGYMAPEQILGEAIDHRADLFSIGVVCYELLTYTEAFPGETLPTITHRILTAEPVSLRQVVPDLNQDLVAIVEKALRKNPNERFDDVDTLRTAVARVRRQVENEMAWDAVAPTVIMDRPSGGGGGVRRGTGSQRQVAGDSIAVGQLTPPPDSQRIDRDELDRRRTEQIEAHLSRSRTHLDTGELEAALAAVADALMLEESHPGALELERQIHEQMEVRRRTEQIDAHLSRSRTHLDAGELEAALAAVSDALLLEGSHPGALELELQIQNAIEARRLEGLRQEAESLRHQAAAELERRELTSAQDLLQQARALDPDNPELKRLERDLRLARVEASRQRQRAEDLKRAIDRAEAALANGETETALAAARDALALDAGSARALELEAEAMRRIEEEAGAQGPATATGATAPSPAYDDIPPTVLIPNRAPVPRGVERTTDVPPTVIAPARRTPVPTSQPPADDAPTVIAPHVLSRHAAATPPPAPTPAPGQTARGATNSGASVPSVFTPAPPPPSQAPAADPVSAPPTARDRAAKTSGAKAPVAPQPRRDYLGDLRGAIARSTASMRAAWTARPKQQRMVLALAAAILVIAVVAAMFVASRPSGPPPMGTVLIDALPWAIVTRIEDVNGVAHVLPEDASTPLQLTLAAGTYRVTLAGPPPDSESRVVTVTVDANGAATQAVERFRTMTPDEYFEQYLTSSAPAPDAGDAAASGGVGAAPAASGAATGAPGGTRP